MLFWHEAEWNGVVVGSMSLLTLLLVAIWRLGIHQQQVIDVSKAS